MNVGRWRESTVNIVYKKINFTQLLLKGQPHKLKKTEGPLLD